MQTKKSEIPKRKNKNKKVVCALDSHVVAVLVVVVLLLLLVGLAVKTFCVLQKLYVPVGPNYPLRATLPTRRHSSRVLSRHRVWLASTNYARPAFGISLVLFVFF